MVNHGLERWVLAIGLTICLIGCGGGGSDSTQQPDITTVTPTTPSPAPEDDPNIKRYFRSEYKSGSWDSKEKVQFSGFGIDGLKYYNSDGTYGFTKYEGAGDYNTRVGVSTHFHLGSIEFYPTVASVQLSIFQLLRNYNHLSYEVINLTRLLLLLDTNGGQSDVINLPNDAHEIISDSGILFKDLLVKPEDFDNSEKVSQLLSRVRKSQLPSVAQAKIYFDEHYNKWLGRNGYSQWSAGYQIDYDGDGVINEEDAFPWDATQWQDANEDGFGDTPAVKELYVHTNGVREYEVDSLNGILYVSDYQGQLYRFELQSGELKSTITLDGVITALEVDQTNGNLYVALTDEYYTTDFVDISEQNGAVKLFNASFVEQHHLELNHYPVDIGIHDSGTLYISAKNTAPLDARLLQTDASLSSPLDILSYRGDGGQIYIGKDKLITNEFNGYTVFDIDNGLSLLADGNSTGFYDSPAFIDSERDVFVDEDGEGFRLSLLPDESAIRDFGKNLIDLSYYDTRKLAATRKMLSTLEDKTNQQYVAMTSNSGVYVSSVSLIPHKVVRFNSYSFTLNNAINYHIYKVAEFAGKHYFIKSNRDGTTHIDVIENQCQNCGSSVAPFASIKLPDVDFTVQDVLLLDASLSFDTEDSTNLRYRWDFNGDGSWDTQFVTNDTYPVKYELSGHKNIRLQVIDSSGLTAESEVKLTLPYGVYKGMLPLSNKLSDYRFIINDTALDEERSKLYMTTYDTGQFLVMNTLSGEIEREFQFRYLTSFMEYSPDKKFLVMGLKATGCQLLIVDCEDDLIDVNDGIILIYNLETQMFVDSFKVDVSPAELSFFDGDLYVSAGSDHSDIDGFQSGIFVYDFETRENTNSLPIGGRSIGEFAHILLREEVASEAQCSNFNNNLKEFCADNFRYVYEAMSLKPKHWLLPSRGIFVDRINRVFEKVHLSELEPLSPSLSAVSKVSDLSIHEKDNVLTLAYKNALLSDGGMIRIYDLETFELKGEFIRENQPEWIVYTSGYLLEISRLGGYQYDVSFIDVIKD